MTITRIGSSEKYAANWAQAFGKGKKTKPAAATVAKRATTPNKSKGKKATKSTKPIKAKRK